VSREIIKVPDIGGSEGVDVIEICVAVGDCIEKEDSLVVLESDKASMEVPSPISGTVIAISISDGDQLSEGDVICELETEVDGVQEEIASIEPPEKLENKPRLEEPAEEATVESAMTTIEVINVPDIGGGENVDVIEVCVNVGDSIAEGDSLIVLETDKASMEVPAPIAGTVISLAIKEGDTASEGSEILQLEISSAEIPLETNPDTRFETVAAAPLEEPIQENKVTNTSSVVSAPFPVNAAVTSVEQAKERSNIYAGPAVRRLAREMGVVLEQVKGTGPKGRIAKSDLKAHVKTALSAQVSSSVGSGIPALPVVDFSQFGEVSIEPLSKIHKVTAKNMHRNWLNVPHVTQFDDADITELEDFRQTLKAEAETRGVKITPLPFLLKACAAALRDNPKFNASLHADGDHLVYKKYINIGIAVDTPAGLVVPVLRDVDKKSIWDLAAETVEMAQKAKDRKLKPIDMQGGCFTLSSLGNIGGQGFTPIVNAPEVAILGISKLAIKPVWDGEEFVPRKMLPLSLSYDHRAINGGDGGRFFTYLTQVLADIRRLVL
jgi:pyruvate dehydrogenase E2 component (dihydrolipoamide acetyltransferase)